MTFDLDIKAGERDLGQCLPAVMEQDDKGECMEFAILKDVLGGAASIIINMFLCCTLQLTVR